MDESSSKWLKRDQFAAACVLFILALFGWFLVLDSPPPSPDFYVYVRQSADMAHGIQTSEKFPPGYPLLLMPASGLSILDAEKLACAIGLVSFVLLGVSLIGIARAIKLPIALILVSSVLANRYVIPGVVQGNSHLPFYCAVACCLWAVLMKRWYLAFAIAAGALLLRYNGAILPLLVSIAFIFAGEPGTRLRRTAISFVAVAACLAPLILWMKIGTSIGVESYVDEIAARGQAGFGVIRYLPATMLAGFLDSSGSERVASLEQVSIGIVLVVLLAWLFLGSLGFMRIAADRSLAIWILGSIGWWVVVHMRFPDVGGHYFYSMQIVWMLWLLVAVGAQPSKATNSVSAIAFMAPILLLVVNEPTTIIISFSALVAIVVAVYGVSRSLRYAGFAGVCATIVAVGLITAKQKIYDQNFRPAVHDFLRWSEENKNVLVTPLFYDVLKLEGKDVSSLIPESALEGPDISASLQALDIRYVAIGTWEYTERDRKKVLESHEFFLGDRYKTELRPYEFLSSVFDGVGWRQVGSFRNRKTEIRIYEKVQ